jgi:DHA1 family bicyclomycin/chloramphenicol resistance-like MFS transporter
MRLVFDFMKKHERHIMVLMFLIPFLMGLGIDLYVPSLPVIANYFQVSSGLVQQTIGFYILSFGIGQLVLGILSDIIGRKKIMLASALCFIAASFLAGFSPNIYLLIIYRFLQGLGVAGLGVAIRAVATDCFVGKDLVKTMSYIATSWALGPIVGPVIGGYLQHYFNWQADFYFFGLYGTLIFIYILLVLPETHVNLLSPQPKRIYRSIKSVIVHPVFLYGSIMLAFGYAILVLFNVIGPFLIQNVLRYSVVAYGNMALFLGLGYFVGNLLNRFLINYFQPMSLVFFAVISGLLVSLVMLLLGMLLTINLYIILPPVLLMLLLCGLIFPNMLAKIMSLFPEQAGTANALYGAFMALGVFLMTVFASTLNTNSQIPMTLTYVGLFLICLLLFIVVLKLGNRGGNKNEL